MTITRRALLSGGAAAATVAVATRAFAQFQPSGRYPDPAIQIVDASFTRYRLGATKVE
jgi:gluconolactonase